MQELKKLYCIITTCLIEKLYSLLAPLNLDLVRKQLQTNAQRRASIAVVDNNIDLASVQHTLRSLRSSKMAVAMALPKDISKLGQEVKLFGKWDTQE